MTVFQRTDYLASSSKPAGSSVCKVTKEGARRGWLPSRVTNFVFLELKKGNTRLGTQLKSISSALGVIKGKKSFFLICKSLETSYQKLMAVT